MTNKDFVEENNGEEFYIVGGGSDYKKRTPWWLWVIIAIIVITAVFFIAVKTTSRQIIHEMEVSHPQPDNFTIGDTWYCNVDAYGSSHIIITDTIVNKINLQIFTPYNTTPSLHVGAFDTSETDIIFATCAADLGSGQGEIIGAFVSEGKPLSWGGGRKHGYCAIIDGNITLGVSENSPLFELATERDGYFFRQYPAINNSVMVENNPKNASFRRSLCILKNRVCIVATFDRVLMNDFAATLVKLGVENAIFLMGGNAEGWYRTDDGTLHQLGKKYLKGNPNINYLVFRAQKLQN